LDTLQERNLFYRILSNALQNNPKHGAGAINTVSEFYEDVTETVQRITPEPIGRALDVVAKQLNKVSLIHRLVLQNVELKQLDNK
jgi:hypothetical protein